jgi:rRNA-processing protein FCF1
VLCPLAEDLYADTNVLISCLELLKEAVEALSKFLSPPIRLLIPLIVIRELDGLKLSTRLVTLPPVQSTSRHSPVKKASSQVELSTLARQATTFILNAIASFPHLIKAQRKAESDDPAIWKTSVANADDKVLDAALYWNVRLPGQVGIVSNDKNLCVKAVAEGMWPSILRRPP